MGWESCSQRSSATDLLVHIEQGILKPPKLEPIYNLYTIPYNVGPLVISWFITPLTVVISTINPSYCSLKPT